VGFIPLAEGGSINLDDGALDKCVRPDQFVVGSIVNLYKKRVRSGMWLMKADETYDTNNSCLASGRF